MPATAGLVGLTVAVACVSRTHVGVVKCARRLANVNERLVMAEAVVPMGAAVHAGTVGVAIRVSKGNVSIQIVWVSNVETMGAEAYAGDVVPDRLVGTVCVSASPIQTEKSWVVTMVLRDNHVVSQLTVTTFGWETASSCHPP